jgi:adenosylhomocysteine nucleosidase
MKLFVVAGTREYKNIFDGLLGVTVLRTGVGKVNAARELTRCLCGHGDVEEVINIGVCGGKKGTKIGEVYTVGTVTEADYDTSLFDGQSFKHNEIVLGGGCRLATADVCATKVWRNYELYDMEGYVVANVCRAFGVPCRLIKSPSDILGQQQEVSFNNTGFVTACRSLRDWVSKA